MYAQKRQEGLGCDAQLSMASRWPLTAHIPTPTARLHLLCESDFATMEANSAVGYDGSLEKEISRGGPMKENGVHTAEMIAQAASQ